MAQAKTLTPAELDQVLDFISHRSFALRNRVMLLTGMWSGMRVSEIASLSVSDVMNANGTIKAEIRLTAEQTKDGAINLYEVGEAMRLNPRLVVKHVDLNSDVREKHLKMSLLVSEYLEKAKNLIAHASEGIFPCTENHDWIERSTRAAYWRQNVD